MLQDVPTDMALLVLGRLQPLDVLRAMMACRCLRTLGARCGTWARMRRHSGLPPPRPRAIKLKTDYDIVMARACKMCFRYVRDRHGFCDECRRYNHPVYLSYMNIGRMEKAAAGLQRRRRRLQAKMRDMEETERIVSGNLKSLRQARLELPHSAEARKYCRVYSCRSST